MTRHQVIDGRGSANGSPVLMWHWCDCDEAVTCKCGQVTVHAEELVLCADSMPYDPRHHCSDCLPDCGPCQDEMAREDYAEKHHT